jgi:hypothetical protein
MILIVVAGSWTRKVTTHVRLGWDNLVFHVTSSVIGSPTISFRVCECQTNLTSSIISSLDYLPVNNVSASPDFAATRGLVVSSFP